MLERLDEPPNGNTDIAGLREGKPRTAIDQCRVAFGSANETFAFVDVRATTTRWS